MLRRGLRPGPRFRAVLGAHAHLAVLRPGTVRDGLRPGRRTDARGQPRRRAAGRPGRAAPLRATPRAGGRGRSGGALGSRRGHRAGVVDPARPRPVRPRRQRRAPVRRHPGADPPRRPPACAGVAGPCDGNRRAHLHRVPGARRRRQRALVRLHGQPRERRLAAPARAQRRHARPDRTQARRTRPAGCQGSGRGRQPCQEHLPGQHEPRAAHAAARDPGLYADRGRIRRDPSPARQPGDGGSRQPAPARGGRGRAGPLARGVGPPAPAARGLLLAGAPRERAPARRGRGCPAQPDAAGRPGWPARPAARRRAAAAPGAAQLCRQRHEVHRPRRHHHALRAAGRGCRGPAGALCRGRHRHRHRRAEPGAPVPAFPAGRRFLDPHAPGHRPGPGHHAAAGAGHGRRHGCREPARRGQHLLVHGPPGPREGPGGRGPDVSCHGRGPARRAAATPCRCARAAGRGQRREQPPGAPHARGCRADGGRGPPGQRRAGAGTLHGL